MPACPNGHPVNGLIGLCPTCGEPIDELPSEVVSTGSLSPAAWHVDPDDSRQLRYWDGTQWTEHRAPRPDSGPSAGTDGAAVEEGADGRPRRLKSNKMLLAIGAVVVLVVGGGVVWAATGKTDTVAAKDHVSAASPHETCVMQLMAIAENMANNNAYGGEMMVNGQNDPFWHAGMDIATKEIGDAYQMGATRATELARQRAEDECSQALNDAVRPNYPTDGSHPDMPADEQGSSSYECPPGTSLTNQSDGQGNFICE